MSLSGRPLRPCFGTKSQSRRSDSASKGKVARARCSTLRFSMKPIAALRMRPSVMRASKRSLIVLAFLRAARGKWFFKLKNIGEGYGGTPPRPPGRGAPLHPRGALAPQPPNPGGCGLRDGWLGGRPQPPRQGCPPAPLWESSSRPAKNCPRCDVVSQPRCPGELGVAAPTPPILNISPGGVGVSPTPPQDRRAGAAYRRSRASPSSRGVGSITRRGSGPGAARSPISTI